MATEEKHNWLQIRIWHILFIVFFSACCLAWLMRWVEHSNVQRRTVAKFEAKVLYQHQLNPDGRYSSASLANPPPGFGWLRYLLGDDLLFATVAQLQINSPVPYGREIKSITSVGQLTGLKSLSVFGCPELSELAGLENLTQLESLYIAKCTNVTDYTPLLRLSHLKQISLSYCNELTELPLQNCIDIETIEIHGAQKFDNLSELGSMPKLTNLSLSGMEYIDLSTVEPNNAQSLLVDNCKSRIVIEGIHNFRFLEFLSLSNCNEIESIAELSQLKNVERICLSGCSSISDFTPLASLSQLTDLDLSFCDGLTNLEWISGLENLERLDIRACRYFRGWQSLKALKNLKFLNVTNCGHIGPKEVEELKEHLPDTRIEYFFG